MGLGVYFFNMLTLSGRIEKIGQILQFLIK